jgi:hypothetical protein
VSRRWQGKDRLGRTFTEWMDLFTACTTIDEAVAHLGTLAGKDSKKLADLQRTFRLGMEKLLTYGYTEERALHDGTRWLLQSWFMIPTDADTQLSK